MNTKDFFKILHKPTKLQNEHILDLEDVVTDYPYFQAARVLYLKGLKNQNSFRYNQNLKTTAIYSTDRSVLFHFITSNAFHSVLSNKQEKDIIEEIEIRDETIIENIYQNTGNDENQDTSLDLSIPVKEITTEDVDEDVSLLDEKALIEKEINDFFEAKDASKANENLDLDLDSDTESIPVVSSDTINELEENRTEAVDVEEPIEGSTQDSIVKFDTPSNETFEETVEIKEEQSQEVKSDNTFSFEIDTQEEISMVETDNTASLETSFIKSNKETLRFEPISNDASLENPLIEVIESDITDEDVEVKLDLDIPKPVHFHENDTHSFNEWMQLSSFKPIDRSRPPISKRQEKMALIDEFMIKKPKIKPNKASGFSVDFNHIEQIEPDVVMTETLANIYIAQKKYENAINAYEILSLKFPEKSSFFADQIKMLKRKQKNASN